MPWSSAVRFAVTAILFVLCGGTVCAQTVSTGAITGFIADPSGAAVTGASVTAVEKNTGAERATTSDSQGSYRLSLLPPGVYRVRFAAKGFTTLVPPEVTVAVTEISALDVTMALGTPNDTVEVSAGASRVQTESPALGTVVDGSVLMSAPLVTRNYTQILTLSPGVAADVSSAAELGRGSQDVYVNGSSNISNSFQLDGAGVNNFGSNRAGDFIQQPGVPVPSPDAIQEFKIQTALFDAGFGRAGGASVNLITRSGTNRFHGSLFEFLRNDKLNANDFFLNSTGQTRPAMKQNQFGGSLGGPFVRDRALFFGSYQGSRQVNGLSPSSYSSNFLPPLTANRSGAELGRLFCGQSGIFGGVAVACDGSNLNPVALRLLNTRKADGDYLIPAPQKISDGVGFSSFSVPGHFNEDQFIVNTDLGITRNHRLAQRYLLARSTRIAPFSSCFVESCLPGSAQNGEFGNHHALLRLVSVLSPHLLHEAMVGFSRYTGVLTSESKLVAGDFGVVPLDPAFPRVPVLSIGGMFSIGGSFNDDSESRVTQIQFADQISWVRGRHAVRLGFQGERASFRLDNLGVGRGFILFLSFPDFLLGLDSAHNGSPMSNVFFSYGVAGQVPKEYRAGTYAAFIQDDFKAARRVTINLGLRWDINGGVSEASGRFSSILPTLAAAVNPPPEGGTYAGWVVPSNFPAGVPDGVVRLPGETLAGNDTPLHNIAPRVGFAWNPLPKSARVAVRGGYGAYFTRTNGTAMVQASGIPFTVRTNLAGPSNGLASFQEPFSAAARSGSFPLRTPASLLSENYVAEHYDSPLTQHLALGLQIEAAPRMVMEAGYVGTRGTRLSSSRRSNEPLLASPSRPVHGITENTVDNAYLRVPIQGFAPGGLVSIDTYGFSWYHGLQAALRRQSGRGIQFQLSYTFGKTLSDVGGAGEYAVFLGGNANSNNPGDRRQQWGPADYDRTHRIVLNYLWELPSIPGSGFVGRALSAGWSVSGIGTIQSGVPLTIGDLQGGSIFAFTGDSRGQLCPGYTLDQVPSGGGIRDRLDRFFNTDAVDTSNPSCPLPRIGDGTGYGNLGRGTFRGPGQVNFDTALSRRIPVRRTLDSGFLEIRVELFNSFNHPQFGIPGTVVGGASFGRIGRTSVAPRLIQLALRYRF